MDTTIFTFKVDRENEVIEFENGYWFPIEDFKSKRNNYENKFVSAGLFHLSKKRWICDSLFNDIVKFCIKEFPDLDFNYTAQYIKEYNDSLNEIFKR